jgi:hypothetical protein
MPQEIERKYLVRLEHRKPTTVEFWRRNLLGPALHPVSLKAPIQGAHHSRHRDASWS